MIYHNITTTVVSPDDAPLLQIIHSIRLRIKTNNHDNSSVQIDLSLIIWLSSSQFMEFANLPRSIYNLNLHQTSVIVNLPYENKICHWKTGFTSKLWNQGFHLGSDVTEMKYFQFYYWGENPPNTKYTSDNR